MHHLEPAGVNLRVMAAKNILRQLRRKKIMKKIQYEF